MIFDVCMVVDCLFEVFDELNMIQDFEYLVMIVEFYGWFVFDVVYFCYQDLFVQFFDLFDGIDFELELGEIMVLVGLIGLGKIMFIVLVICFYDVIGGFVWFDGVDICDFICDEF